MRIALLSWESLHSIPVGGVAAHVTELAAALRRRGHEVHVFTRNDDPFAICTAIWDLFGEPERARRMGKCGRTKAAHGFSWDSIAKQTEAVYREIA